MLIGKRVYISGSGRGSVAKALVSALNTRECIVSLEEKVSRRSEVFDIGVCLAGRIEIATPDSVDLGLQEDLWKANYRAPRSFIEDCIAHMPNGGHIFVFGSVAARYGNVYAEDYAAYKAGIAKYCELRARSAREQGIKISLLNFGAIDSAFWVECDRELGRNIMPDAEKALKIDEVVSTILALAELPTNVCLKDATIVSAAYQ